MDELKFKWNGAASLADEVRRPLSRISLELDPHGRLMRGTLWGSSGVGLRVQSEMYDLADRIEVGVLSFALVSTPKEGEKIVDLGPGFQRVTQAIKLVVHESGSSAESGLLIRSETGQEIVIVAASHPYQIAVEGVVFSPKPFEPEYPLDRYERIELA